MNSLTVTKVNSKTNVTLNLNNYLSSGGQADLYVKDNLVYKIFHESNIVVPEKKIEELRVLNKDNIVIPIEHIRDKNSLVGFTCKEVKNCKPIIEVMTNVYWKNNRIKIDDIVELVNFMKDTISFIHDKKCLIIDANEYNFLVNNVCNYAYFIDVDSYQTPSFKASYITPSIKDYHTNNFNELTDWFSFAILACQLFVGMHPFKGKHNKYKTIPERVLNNISIFNKDVRINSNVRDFSYIPQEYMKWFNDLFEKGLRNAPPTADGGMINIIVPQIQVINNTDVFRLTYLSEYEEEINNHRYFNGTDIIHTDNFTFLNYRKYQNKKRVGLTENSNFVFVDHENEKLCFDSTNNSIVKHVDINANNMFVYDNNAFFVNKNTVSHICFKEFNNIIVPFIDQNSKKILENSTKFFDGYFVIDIFKDKYFCLPYHQNKNWKWCELKINELKDYKLINGKRRKNIIILAGYKDGIHDKIVVKFDENYSSYVIRIFEDVDYLESNFDVLDSGICVHMIEDHKIELFYSKFEDNSVKLIEDFKIDASMIIIARGNSAAVVIEKKLYKISTK